uniref:Uncharacterized protein n=1 Tax=Oryza brachyantha TaxID=4533 RepID=J3ME89_ORYBR
MVRSPYKQFTGTPTLSQAHVWLLVGSNLSRRFGSHLVHSMHGALELLPYSLVNHSLPIYGRFSLEYLRNNIYAEAKKGQIQLQKYVKKKNIGVLRNITDDTIEKMCQKPYRSNYTSKVNACNLSAALDLCEFAQINHKATKEMVTLSVPCSSFAAVTRKVHEKVIWVGHSVHQSQILRFMFVNTELTVFSFV